MPRASLLLRLGLATAASLTAACGTGEAAPTSLIQDPLQPLPGHLSATGLFELPERAFTYEPLFPLWSNGSLKERTAILPDGTSVEPAAHLWEFPVGTLFFKTFSFGAPGQERPVETRVMRLSPEGWDYAAYLWDAAADDAELLGEREAPRLSLSDGAGPAFEHKVPSGRECRRCHEAGPARVLGFGPPQVSPETLATLTAQGVFGSLPEHTPLPGAGDAYAVLGYFVGNCVHCHDGGDGENNAFDLRPDVAFENLIDQPTASSASAAGTRVVPGRPEESILFLAVARDTTDPEIKAMPPIGVQRVDDSAVALLERWIRELP
jgi:hypothetical protein